MTRPRVVPAKIVIAGGFGVGKTTLVGVISEIPPLTTEAIMTEAAAALDDLSYVAGKTETTVAMDFGRITIDEALILYLFGTPGQHRFWFMWDELTRGAIGAVVLADTRRLADAFGPLDFFEHHQLPYVVAINMFDGMLRHEVPQVREALAVGPHVPVVACDVRLRADVRDVLVTLVEHALDRRRSRTDSPPLGGVRT